MKADADTKRRDSLSNLKTGDVFLVWQQKHTTRFDPSPFELMTKKGTMVTACWDRKYIARNILQFKTIGASLKEPNRKEDSEDDLNTDDRYYTDCSTYIPLTPTDNNWIAQEIPAMMWRSSIPWNLTIPSEGKMWWTELVITSCLHT